ncbi:DnaA regulatory inactivator Hda [Methylomonas sp. SURF-2]|uniref:DnaA regulatory inactivator Hda n=1 Tax=Methylomonas subterranea TaxID=2952225 RepID=A0ABT1TG21_9GAMM|nr:DnaA regulatory inactivator Hda [Methylomonas sp. SURF-2]MCQ8104027.1 DnaA regulatory inactivator Hda [Methylomonas sp. SURF-2]
MQVPLQFEFQTNPSFAGFFAGHNGEIITSLRAMAGDGAEQQLYIWGESGSGKSHLLQACCQQAKAGGKDPFYLKFIPDRLPSPKLLEGLEDMELVCFDDLRHIAGHADWESALFAFYNSHRQNNHKLLLAADCPPKYLPFDLPDLKTRMGWGLTLKIQPLRDDQIIDALTFKAHFLGFDIPPKVGRFLLNHYVHDLPALWRLLEKIDKATLAAQRKLTIPFLKQILAEQS